MNAEQFLTPPISLARDIDNGDDRAACAVVRVGNRRAHVPRQSPALIETHLAAARPWEAVLRIRHHRDEARRLASQYRIRDAHAFKSTQIRSGAAGQCVEPNPAAA